MANQVTFHKRVPQGVNKGTLAELMARQAEAARAASSAQEIQTPTIMQGLGKIGQIGAGIFQERRAAKEEGASREAVAKIIAGIPPEGADQQTIADLGIYDTELAEQYRQEAVAARAAAAERANVLADRTDTRTYEDAREGRIDVREAGQAAATLREERAHEDAVTKAEREYNERIEAEKVDREGGIRIQERNLKKQEAADAFNRQYALDAEKARRDAEAEMKKPSGSLGQLMSDVEKFNNGAFGDPLDPRNQSMFKAAFAHNASVPKGMTLTTNPDGTFTLEQGGSETGDPLGSTRDLGNQADFQQSYLTDQKLANDALAGIQSARKMIDKAGYTGPGGEYWGQADDFIEGMEAELGMPKAMRSWLSLSGDPAARALIDINKLSQQLSNVQKTTGAISNAEMEIFGRAAAGIGKNPEANAIILDMAEAIIGRVNERAQLADAYAKAHGGRLDAGFEADWQARINANPLIGEDKNGMPFVIKPGDKPRETVTPVEPNAAVAPAPAAAPAASAPAGGAPAAGGGPAPVPGWSMEEWNALDEEDRKELLKPKTGLP